MGYKPQPPIIECDTCGRPTSSYIAKSYDPMHKKLEECAVTCEFCLFALTPRELMFFLSFGIVVHNNIDMRAPGMINCPKTWQGWHTLIATRRLQWREESASGAGPISSGPTLQVVSSGSSTGTFSTATSAATTTNTAGQ